jgi:hypothetical protein
MCRQILVSYPDDSHPFDMLSIQLNHLTTSLNTYVFIIEYFILRILRLMEHIVELYL